MRLRARLLWILALLAARAEPACCEELPGPRLDLPVDLDGDGAATFGDRYAFNYWLALGGGPGQALAEVEVVGGVLRLARFFDSGAAALAQASPLLARRAPARRSEPPAAGGGPPATSGRLLAPFDQQVPQVYAVLRDPKLLGRARGHALAGGALFVAHANEDPVDAGVTRIDSIEDIRGTIPIRARDVAPLVAGIRGANKLAYDPTSGALFVTASCPPPGEAAAVTGIGGLASPSSTRAVVACGTPPPLPGGSISPPAFAVLEKAHGVVALLADLACGGEAGDLIVSESSPSTAFDRFGFLAQVTLSSGEAPASVLPRYCGLHLPRGIAVGDFGGSGAFGIYFATTDDNLLARDWQIRRATPALAGGRCTWDAGLAVHTAFTGANDEAEVDDVAFDPFSPTLFVTAGRRIYRIRAEAAAEPVPFADNLASPRGISFPRTGVILVSEEGTDTLTAIDGWRFRFIRGDVNADLRVDLADAQFLEEWLFLGRREGGCYDAADAADDGEVDLADAVYILNFAVQQGPAPSAPFPGLGSDATEDLLGCRSYHASGAIGF